MLNWRRSRCSWSLSENIGAEREGDELLFLDTSALIKALREMSWKPWLETTVFRPAGNMLLISRITVVEMRSALTRRKRKHPVPQDHADALSALHEDCLTRYRFVRLETPVVDLAGNCSTVTYCAYGAVSLLRRWPSIAS
ncbi:type II toxin-antitoxin system VapC family toxin [Candidatus Amarolinea aalborgensis]|uniref:type II toxin-antitoxin system VapC family toxin n=1 Tax=Candidatus Amarolinea aalborgensis TaxID=2249329 RepID=UPI003BF9CBAB